MLVVSLGCCVLQVLWGEGSLTYISKGGAMIQPHHHLRSNISCGVEWCCVSSDTEKGRGGRRIHIVGTVILLMWVKYKL